MTDFTFNGQRKDEDVLEVVQNHPYVIYPACFRTMLLAVVAIGIFLFAPSSIYFLAVIILLFAFVFFSQRFYSYKESIFLITNTRVFNIEQKGFFKRKITEVEVDRIQDISSDTAGMFRTMLKYGDLIVRTAGASQGTEMIVHNIPNPYYYQQVVTRLMNGKKG
ncbi:MAG TPA: PH domain-containing protein [bacterium]|nr:PH domain-containing protein [bacterium]